MTVKNEIQTHKRLKGTLFIRTRQNQQMFRVIPFVKLQNDTQTTAKSSRPMKNEVKSETTVLVFLSSVRSIRTLSVILVSYFFTVKSVGLEVNSVSNGEHTNFLHAIVKPQHIKINLFDRKVCHSFALNFRSQHDLKTAFSFLLFAKFALHSRKRPMV